MKRTQEELEQRNAEITARLQELDNEYAGQALPDAERSEWNTLNEERDSNDKLIGELRARRERLESIAANPENREAGAVFHTRRPNAVTGDDIYDLSTVRMSADSPEAATRELRDRAKRAIDTVTLPDDTIDTDAAKAHVERLVERRDTRDGALSRHLLLTGSPVYERAFGKSLMGGQLTQDEQRALAITTPGTAGLAVPFALDPTVLNSSNGSVNPIRQIARVETIVQGNTWQGISSAGLTSTYGYAAEATEASDNAPVLAQPEVKVEKAQAFVPMSIEVSQDWTGVMGELARMFADAKDDVEAAAFVNGSGTNEPSGILDGLTASELVDSDTDETFAVEDLYLTEEALGPRHRARASWLASRNTYNLIRQFASADGPEVYRDRLPQGLGAGRMQADLLGYPAYESTAMPSIPESFDGDVELMVFGDFRHYLIVDKVGMTVEVIPHLFATNANRPSGQRGVYAYWRNGAGVLVPNAFRVLNITETS